MPMWLNKASLLHLPLLEPFKQDVTVSSSEPTMFTFASTRRATVQFSILMLLGTIPGYVASICIHICVGKLVCSASRFAYFDSYWSCTAAVLDYMTDIESQHLQVIALNRSVSFVHGWPLCGAVEPRSRSPGGFKWGMFSSVDCRWHASGRSITQVTEEALEVCGLVRDTEEEKNQSIYCDAPLHSLNVGNRGRVGQGRQLGSGFEAGSFKSFVTLAQLIGFTVLKPPDLQFGRVIDYYGNNVQNTEEVPGVKGVLSK